MNELIKKLWATYSCEQRNESADCIEDFVDRTDFAEAIETACKAQRNACVRDFNNYAKRHEYSNNCARVILKAKIERQDYE